MPPALWLSPTPFLVWKAPGGHDLGQGLGWGERVHQPAPWSLQAQKQVYNSTCNQDKGDLGGKTTQMSLVSTLHIPRSTEVITCFLRLAFPSFPHSLIVQPFKHLLGPDPGNPEAR